jgi:hypothetical protein
MGQREDLHTLLKQLLQTNNVYFQPPPTVKMDYPCIVYKRDNATTIFAGDKPYNNMKRYQIIVIDRDPDSDIPTKVAELPMCTFNRFYTADNLNHDVYNLFF